MPSSSERTSFKMADLSTLGWDDAAGWEKEAGSWLVAALKGKPGSSFSQAELEGIKPGEKTQGRVAADPRAAYTLVSSLGGWTIPANSTRGETTAVVQNNEAKSSSCLYTLPFIVRVTEALPTSPL